MRFVRYLQHWLSGTGARLQVTDCVPVMHPIRQWADTFLWVVLVRAIDLTRSGGTIVYCTCSLEQEEGEHIVSAVVEQDTRVHRKPITAAEFPVLEEFITPRGELRTPLPIRSVTRIAPTCVTLRAIPISGRTAIATT